MKKYKISIFISLVSICGMIIQNYRLAEMYFKADGKTRALFSLIELAQLDVKIYLWLISIVSLSFGILAIRKKEDKLFSTFSVCLSGISNILLFIKFWTLRA